MKKKFLTLTGITGILSVLVITGCNPGKKFEKAEKELINNYISSLGDTVYSLKPSGLYYIELEEGTGRMPIDKDTVSVRYTVKLLSGEMFDSNMDADDPFTFIVGNIGYVILGLNEGIQYMKNGGRGKFVIPSWLAYGPEGMYPYISGYTPLLVYVELEDVKEGPVE